MFVYLVLDFTDQIFVKLLLSFLNLCEQAHNVSFTRVCGSVCALRFVDYFLGNRSVFIHELVAHSVELRCLLFKFELNIF
jgi:hypothetical protein